MNRSLPSPYGRHLQGSQDEGLTDATGRSHLTLRGFWVGAFLSFFLSIGAPYANMAMRATNMAFDFNTPGAIFLLLVLVGLLNTLFKLAARDFRLAVGLALLATGGFCGYWASRGTVDWYSPGFWFGAFLALSSLWNVPVVQRGGTLALNRAELVLVYAMLLVVSALCTMGLTQQLLPALTGNARHRRQCDSHHRFRECPGAVPPAPRYRRRIRRTGEPSGYRCSGNSGRGR